MRDLPPLAAFEAAALVRGEHGADEVGLGSAIRLAVVSMLRRERDLQLRIGLREPGIGAQRVAERQLLGPAGAGLGHDVQVRVAPSIDDTDEEPAPRPGVELGWYTVPAVGGEHGGELARMRKIGDCNLQVENRLGREAREAVEPTCSTGATSQGAKTRPRRRRACSPWRCHASSASWTSTRSVAHAGHSVIGRSVPQREPLPGNWLQKRTSGQQADAGAP